MRLDPAMHLPRKMLLVCIVACLFLAARASVALSCYWQSVIVSSS